MLRENPKESGQADLFRSLLVNILDLGHRIQHEKDPRQDLFVADLKTAYHQTLRAKPNTIRLKKPFLGPTSYHQKACRF